MLTNSETMMMTKQELADYHFAEYLKLKGELEADKPIASLGMFPISDLESRKYCLLHENVHWSEQEFDLGQDKASYRSLSKEKKRVIDFITSYFFAADGSVSETLKERLISRMKNYESKAFSTSQDHIELVHALGYMNFIMLTKDVSEEEWLRETNLILERPSVKNKINFLREVTYDFSVPLWELYVYQSCVEGIFFCSSFNIIFWFRSNNELTMFAAMNEMISRDETMHRNYAAYMAGKLIKEYLDSIEDPVLRSAESRRITNRIIEIIKRAVELEIDFVQDLLPEPIVNISDERVITFVKCISDNLLFQYDLEPIYNVKNDCEWVNEISFTQKTNFYDGTVSAYNRGDVKKFLSIGLEEMKEQEDPYRTEKVDF